MWQAKHSRTCPGMALLCSAAAAAAVAVLLLRLRSCSGRRARIRDTRDGDKVHRPSRIRPTLSCLLVDNEGEPLGDPFVLREPRGSVSFGGRRHDSEKKNRHSSYSSPSWSYQPYCIALPRSTPTHHLPNHHFLNFPGASNRCV